MMEVYILVYCIIINCITFIVWGYDKWQAVRNGKIIDNATAGNTITQHGKGKKAIQYTRISEKQLLTLVLLGGGVGALLGMQIFYHKTKKSSFLWKVMSILVVYIALIARLTFRRS